MTAHPDPMAVRAAAERLAKSWIDHYRFAASELPPELRGDIRKLTLGHLALTDPTPLSVKVLAGMGFVENPKSELCYKFGRLCCYADGPPEAWEWTYGNDGIHDVPPWLNPRTAGELRQLLDRMGK